MKVSRPGGYSPKIREGGAKKSHATLRIEELLATIKAEEALHANQQEQQTEITPEEPSP